jgi:hypothetical protein
MIKQFIDHVKKMALKGIFLARQNHKHLAFFPHLFSVMGSKNCCLSWFFSKLFFPERFSRFDALKKKSSRFYSSMAATFLCQ